MVGRTLAHYEITEKIGAGGMGEVYRARDTKLGRDVALKFLPESFAADAERLSRFEREAKLLAALSHGHIAAIHGIEHSGEERFLVLEFVGGEDLAERLARGPVSVDDTLALGLQIAEALEAAHEQGVIHRDLKPANIKVAPDGTAKVLDFGLAKALDLDDGSSGTLSHSPTLLASSPTVQGVILGTAAYMSPEQARGKTVDRRADIWAFGVVLFEMLTGRQCFTGETVSDTLASVLKTDPEWEALPDGVPPAVTRLLRRCLTKDPRQRLRDIGEARILIDRVIRGEADEGATPSEVVIEAPRSIVRRAMWPVVTVVLVALAFVVAWMARPGAPEPTLRKFSLAVESEQGETPVYPMISPDGRRVAYVLGGRLWIQDLDKLEPRELPAQAGVDMPFWSPDGAHVGYESRGALWKVPVTGGPSVKICDPPQAFVGGRGANWGPGDRIVFSYGGGALYEVAAGGGDPAVYLELDPAKDADFHEPSLLPEGRGALFVTHRKGASADTIELLADGERRVILQVDGERLWSPTYTNSGHILYRRTGSNDGIWALPFSLSTLEVTGEPFLAAPEGSFPSVSSDGTLVYLRGGVGGQTYWLVRVDRTGAVIDSIGAPTAGTVDPSLSPDGRRLAAVERNDDEIDIWIHDIVRGTRTRFTFTEGNQLAPEWTPDGKEIYYRHRGDTIFARSSDGTGAPRLITPGHHPSISPDGRWLVYDLLADDTSRDLWVLSLTGDGEPRPFLMTPARELRGRISPDGAHVAYQSDESGQNEIYLTRFPSGEGKWQVSIGGGEEPRWGRSGHALYYRKDDCIIMEVTVETDPSITLGRPQALVDCEAAGLARSPWPAYEVVGDGESFIGLRATALESTIDIGITVVENWTTEFGTRK